MLRRTGGDEASSGGKWSAGGSALHQPRGTRLLALLPTVLIAGALCLITFIAGGGLEKGPTTSVELAITIGAGLISAAAILIAPEGRPLSGASAAGLLFVFAALSAISIAWSVTPNASWEDASRLFAYASLFAAAVLSARAAPSGWKAVLGGVVLAASVICAYALATKVFPGQLDPNDPYPRLRAPYGYWNATGLTAAMGMIACLWLGSRRSGHAVITALAYPAIGLMLITLMLSYSRGSVAVAVLGAALWLSIVPLRLRGATLLIAGALGAAIAVGFDFAESALSSENVALAQRIAAGHRLGVLLLGVLIALTAAGLTIGFLTARHPPRERTRRRAGAALFTLLVLAVLAGAGALSLTHRGLAGTITHDVNTLVNPNAVVPGNTPGRLTSAGSVRARYWQQALEVFEAHPILGVGAEGYATARLRYQTGNAYVVHAHSYVMQTLADLGLLGIIVTLALLIAWIAAAGAATHPLNRRWHRWRWRKVALEYTPERIGLLTMVCIVVTFGLHSLEDWTWYVPGTACVALLCAGWVAGRGRLHTSATAAGREAIGARNAGPLHAGGTAAQRGPLHTRSTLTTRSRRRLRLLAAAAALAASLLIAWSQWQPQRSSEASAQALSLLASHPRQALAKAREAHSIDPLSAGAMFTLAAAQQGNGEARAAETTLLRAAQQQPANPATWLALGRYELSRDPQAALRELRAALYLDPQSITVENEYVLALRATGQGAAAESR